MKLLKLLNNKNFRTFNYFCTPKNYFRNSNFTERILKETKNCQIEFRAKLNELGVMNLLESLIFYLKDFRQSQRLSCLNLILFSLGTIKFQIDENIFKLNII